MLWEKFEERLKGAYVGLDPVIAALQLYSDKTLLNMKGRRGFGLELPCQTSDESDDLYGCASLIGDPSHLHK